MKCRRCPHFETDHSMTATEGDAVFPKVCGVRGCECRGYRKPRNPHLMVGSVFLGLTGLGAMLASTVEFSDIGAYFGSFAIAMSAFISLSMFLAAAFKLDEPTKLPEIPEEWTEKDLNAELEKQLISYDRMALENEHLRLRLEAVEDLARARGAHLNDTHDEIRRLKEALASDLEYRKSVLMELVDSLHEGDRHILEWMVKYDERVHSSITEAVQMAVTVGVNELYNQGLAQKAAEETDG